MAIRSFKKRRQTKNNRKILKNKKSTNKLRRKVNKKSHRKKRIGGANFNNNNDENDDEAHKRAIIEAQYGSDDEDNDDDDDDDEEDDDEEDEEIGNDFTDRYYTSENYMPTKRIRGDNESLYANHRKKLKKNRRVKNTCILHLNVDQSNEYFNLGDDLEKRFALLKRDFPNELKKYKTIEKFHPHKHVCLHFARRAFKEETMHYCSHAYLVTFYDCYFPMSRNLITNVQFIEFYHCRRLENLFMIMQLNNIIITQHSSVNIKQLTWFVKLQSSLTMSFCSFYQENPTPTFNVEEIKLRVYGYLNLAFSEFNENIKLILPNVTSLNLSFTCLKIENIIAPKVKHIVIRGCPHLTKENCRQAFPSIEDPDNHIDDGPRHVEIPKICPSFVNDETHYIYERDFTQVQPKTYDELGYSNDELLPNDNNDPIKEKRLLYNAYIRGELGNLI